MPESRALASLAGLEAALDSDDQKAVGEAVDLILTLHAMILSFGGIPLLWYGDEIGTLNDNSFLEDSNKARDARWIHRPRIDWTRAEKRNRAVRSNGASSRDSSA
jgi:amylosucrase